MQSSEFRGKALGGDVWVGFRPSAVRWGVRVRRVEVRPWVGVCVQGLGSVQLEGASEGGGLGLGPQWAPQGPSGQGEPWPCSLPILYSPKGLPCH